MTGRKKKAGPKAKAPAPKNADEAMALKIKELEKAFFSVKFYPVAVKEEDKEGGLKKIKEMYEGGDDSVRQLVLYMAHEYLSNEVQLKVMHNFDFFKAKTPNADAGQLRISVYRGMFNYNNSLEGIMEVIRLLGSLDGNADDAAKVLTYHFSFLSSMESEATRMLRNSIIEALGKSSSEYALKSLLNYAKYSDDDRTLGRLADALGEWDEKLDSLRLSKGDKERLRAKLKEVITKEQGGSHYG